MAKFKILTLIAFISLSVSIYADNSNDESSIIEIEKQGTNNQSRMPAECPISAFYQNGIIFFNFSSDIGELNINLTHTVSGENWEYNTASGMGSFEINIPYLYGEYNIYLISLSGDVYFAKLHF